MPGYEYRKPRHPMYQITITPEEDERIERQLANVKRPRITDEMVGLTKPEPERAPCGSIEGYWAHKYRRETADTACKAAFAVYRKERRAAGLDQQGKRKAAA